DQDPEVRGAGFVYLIASHAGTALLMVMFVVLGHQAHSYRFSAFPTASLTDRMRDALFVLALLGFGSKAGLVPLHVWLPRAHPAAPSHVSAVLSGVMIKLGVYGLLRLVLLLGVKMEWGVILLVVGVASALAGALFALAQSDLKRLLASS